MDHRTALSQGTVLKFPGMPCTIRKEIGRGSNTIVYQSSYPDYLHRNMYHKVLIKELFPYHSGKEIFRGSDGGLRCLDNAREVWERHRASFERGNQIHLNMMLKHPEKVTTNLNTFAEKNTLYTVIGYTNGRSIEQERRKNVPSLRVLAMRMIMLLNVLTGFHEEGYLYLDIGPDNILLTGAGMEERVFFIDYNSVHEKNTTPFIKTDSLFLKAGFTAPEIRAGDIAHISEASDLYSVAAVFYYCLTGTSLTPFQMIRQPPPVVDHCPMLADAANGEREIVRRILWRGLQTIPERRYAGTMDMMRDFQELLYALRNEI